jgi:drug/metabolite transporter (DMT)-like permease
MTMHLSNENGRSLRLRADAAIVAVTAVWGLSFIVVKHALDDGPPLAILAFRFLLAAAILLPVAIRRTATAGLITDGAAAGSLLALGLAFQISGQVTTTASKAAFLTGVSIVLTPFAAWIRARRLPSLENGIGIALASIGFAWMTFPKEGWAIGRGDGLMLGCAVLFAFYIVELGEHATRHDPVWLTTIQLAVVTVVAAVLALLLRLPVWSPLRSFLGESRPLVWTPSLIWSLVYLGSIGTVGTFLAQTWAQRHVSAIHAAILFALEPVFAALLAAWLLSERLGTRGTLGALVILAGIVVSEVRLRR